MTEKREPEAYGRSPVMEVLPEIKEAARLDVEDLSAWETGGRERFFARRRETWRLMRLTP